MTKQTITIEFDPAQLSAYQDEFLAFLWHLAQHNPASHGDYAAGELAAKIGAEIVRRWLKDAPVAMYHHQQRDNYWSALTQLARYEPPAGATSTEDGWHKGRWVPKATEANQ